MPDDAELLRCFAETKSEEAFRALVARQIDFVFATALRRLDGDVELAEDVSQAVFSDLARKAARLAHHPLLRGWLHRSTHYAALNARGAKRLRAQREREARIMNEPTTANATGTGSDELRPVVDALLDRLNDRERAAVILRFFEGRTFAEVGATIRLNEDAARMLVGRALEKLRGILARRGVTSTTAALTLALSSQAQIAAPAGLAATVATAALTGSAPGSAAALGTLFAMSKIKTAMVSGLVVAGLATAVVEVRANRSLRAELGALRAQREETAAAQREHRRLLDDLGRRAADDPALAELAQLRRRAAVLAARPPGVVDAAFQSASSWRDAGRATVEAASETLHWALFTGNLDRVADLVVFRDDGPEARAAFMAKCSEAIRTRYPRPEWVVAAGLFGVGSGAVSHDPNDALQVLGEDDHVGGDGTRFGQKRLRVWYRTASGREFAGGERWEMTASGWALGALALGGGGKSSDSALAALANLDPVTGDRAAPRN